MATVAPKPVIEVTLNNSTWTNVTNGATGLDGIDIIAQAQGSVYLEKLSSATPNTTGLTMNPNNVYVFTKVAAYDVWAKGTGSIRLESAK